MTRRRRETAAVSPATADGEWDVIAVMPNLQVSRKRWSARANDSPDLVESGIDLGSRWISIAPTWDERVADASNRHPQTKRLLSSFHDDYGKPIEPCALIAAKGAPIVDRWEAITSFRNSVALSVVLRARAAWVAEQSHQDASWSDYFDFHPTRATDSGLLTKTAALTGIHSNHRDYRAMPSPYVGDRVHMLLKDGSVYRLLGKEWRSTFRASARPTRFARALFRSLELAYLACSAPAKHGGSEHEWGLQIGLWISALEALAWLDHGHANQWYVLNLLGEYPWDEENRLRHRRYVARFKGKPRRINAVQRACSLLYRARHAYMHGDRLYAGLLMPWGSGPDAPSLPAFAPVVYRTALLCYLARRHPTGVSNDNDDWLMELMTDSTYAQAVQVAFGISD